MHAYDRLLGDHLDVRMIDGLQPHERKELLFMAESANFGARWPKYTRQLELIIDSRIRHREGSANEIELVCRELLNQRQFAAARRLAQASGLQGFEFTIENLAPRANSPTVLSVDGPKLTRKPFDVTRDAQVIVLSSPGCPHCLEAARDISNDPRLKEIFMARGAWIAPAYDLGYGETFTKWNQNYPWFPPLVMYDAREWPDSITGGTTAIPTPTFVFLENGKVRRRIMGWGPGAADETELLTALKEIGIAR
ncbi:MAG TPA: hypothetical protein PKE27_04315 [Povalibacter sp.]|uniref:hypothetical protein n=1 Tax=Povalibacter sp. TaxID=1962978 RepID=UPI002C3D8E5E|nr:hypothetical protein [Povalibacter sp.]HMN43768.1 hypothetical protein [Povalibacter sp.]